MRCKIADLIVEIPELGDMPSRCTDYLYSGTEEADIVIKGEDYNFTLRPEASRDMTVYMQSGALFYRGLLCHNGIMLHSSALEYKGRAYLFSGPSGVGKSTHVRLWQESFEDVSVINDDKPALRLIDGVWYAYGTPWSGKHGININKRVPLGGICFIERGNKNSIRAFSIKDAIVNIIGQTTRRKLKREQMELLLSNIERLIQDVPIYCLECLPDRAAAILSHNTMTCLKGVNDEDQ